MNSDRLMATPFDLQAITDAMSTLTIAIANATQQDRVAIANELLKVTHHYLAPGQLQAAFDANQRKALTKAQPTGNRKERRAAAKKVSKK